MKPNQKLPSGRRPRNLIEPSQLIEIDPQAKAWLQSRLDAERRTSSNNNNNSNEKVGESDKPAKKRKSMIISDSVSDEHNYFQNSESTEGDYLNCDDSYETEKKDSTYHHTSKKKKYEKADLLTPIRNMSDDDDDDDDNNNIDDGLTNEAINRFNNYYNSYEDTNTNTPNFTLPNCITVKTNNSNSNSGFTINIPPTIQLIYFTDKSTPISQYIDNNRPPLPETQKIKQLHQFKFSQKITKKMGHYDDALILHNNIFQFKLVNIEDNKIVDVIISDYHTNQLYIITDRRLFDGWVKVR